VKGRLNGKPIRIIANPSLFNQNKVNFVETMFYDKLAPTEEFPIFKTLGALILKEEEYEEGNNHDLRNLLDRERQKKEEASSSESRQ